MCAVNTSETGTIISREIRFFKIRRSVMRNHLETPFRQETLYSTIFYAERPAFSGF